MRGYGGTIGLTQGHNAVSIRKSIQSTQHSPMPRVGTPQIFSEKKLVEKFKENKFDYSNIAL